MKRYFSIWVVAMTAVMLLGCGTNPVTGKSELQAFSYEQAADVANAVGDDGKTASQQVEEEFGGLLNHPQIDAYLQRMGDALVKSMLPQLATELPFKPEWRFRALNSDIVNAFALPNGYIYFTLGILKMMEDDAELAAVMGHEITHVSAGHTRSRLQQAVGMAVLVEVAGAGGGAAAGSIAQVATAIVGLKYSRADEMEADTFGIKWMVGAGYTPWGMVDLQRKFVEMSGGDGSDFLKTHPASTKRVANAQEIIVRDHATFKEGGKDQGADSYRRGITAYLPK